MEVSIKYGRGYIIAFGILAAMLIAAAVAIAVVAIQKGEFLGYLYAWLIFLALAAIMTFHFIREFRKRNKTITISPEGIRDGDGGLIPAGEIDYCFINYRYFRLRTARYEWLDKSFKHLVVVRKDGKKTTLDLAGYKIGEKQIVPFHEKVNSLPGMPEFRPSVKGVPCNMNQSYL